MININAINRMLSQLMAEGYNLPSSQVAVRSVFGDILTSEGLFKDARQTDMDEEQYNKTVERLVNALPDYFTEEKIKERSVEQLERMIVNYNKTQPQSKWISMQGMSFSQLVKAAHEVGVRIAERNIYDPRFGMTLADVITSIKAQMRGDGE